MAELAGKMEEELSDAECAHLLELKQQFMQNSSKMKRRMRRDIRYRLFRIRDQKKGWEQYDKGLKKFFDARFAVHMTWENFTFEWDIKPIDPFEILEMFEWEAAGGKFETIYERDPKTGVSRPRRICDPTAFTHQEM